MNAAREQSAPDQVLALQGELTIYTAAENLARLQDYLRDRRVCDLDLSAVSEIDSAGLQLLLWTRRMAESRRGRLRLVARSAAGAEVIDLLQLEHVFGGNSADAAVEDPS